MADQNSTDFDQRSTSSVPEDMLSLSTNERIDRLSHMIRHRVAQALGMKIGDYP